MGIAVFDIDGVVADVRHRVHWVERRPKQWLRFFEAAADDLPSHTGISWALTAAEQHELVWLTGRPEWLRKVTGNWLTTHGLPVGELIMRGNRDFRPASEYKVAALHAIASAGDIAVFVDDDPDVVQAAAQAGFTASLARWIPRGAALAEAQGEAGRT